MARRAAKGANKELLSKEKFIGISPRGGGDLRVHLAYPNSYWVGMSNLGFQAVFGIFSNQEGVVIERAFLPDLSEQDNQGGTPYQQKKGSRSNSHKKGTKQKGEADKVAAAPWKTLESEQDLANCDVLGFSLSFETDYPHLLKMLGATGLLFSDHSARDKARDEGAFYAPLIIAGGTAVTLNPEPVAPFIDVIVVGEAEELIPEMTKLIRDAKRAGTDRLTLLYQLAQLEGVYVPRFYTPEYDSAGKLLRYTADPKVPARAKRRFVSDLSKFPTHTKILTPDTEFKSMFLTETGRGCEMGCRFCVAGYIYRPIRKRSEETLTDSVKVGLENSNAIGFVGASVSSHKAIKTLTAHVAESGARASLSSIMSQMVSRELATSLSESEYKTVALAPEAGSERLRRAAGKRVRNEQVVEAALQLAESGIRGFKLYFIIGLPTETDEDTEAIATLSLQVRDAVVGAAKKAKAEKGSSASNSGAWVQLSVNPFIPKASTPFQWEPMIDVPTLDRKIALLSAKIKKEKNIEMRFEPPRESYFQALLSRGDRRVAQYLQLAEERGKDWKWILQQGEDALHEEYPTLYIPSIDYYAKRRFGFDEFLPWEVIDSRIEKSLLFREAMRAHHGEQYGRRGQGEDQELSVPAVSAEPLVVNL